ncbi:hypothetical protein HDV02_005598, partial [Globomyces sp. JEL0801]
MDELPNNYQPKYQPTMTVEGKSLTGQFSRSLLSPTDTKIFCISLLCPCILYGQNQAITKQESCSTWIKDSCLFTFACLFGCYSCIGAYGRS